MRFTKICDATYGRERDRSVWIDVPEHAARFGLLPNARFARALILELRAHNVRGLIVARVTGIPRERKP